MSFGVAYINKGVRTVILLHRSHNDIDTLAANIQEGLEVCFADNDIIEIVLTKYSGPPAGLTAHGPE
ncbi:MAG: hypothetical protein WA610_01610 [Thermodesulfovibrionales bacterium]